MLFSSKPIDKSNDLFQRKILLDICLVALAGIILRIIFFSGYMGSDDVVYIERAIEISKNIWKSADYNGALRYGFNIPAGILIKLFGKSIVVANLWPMICSIAEIICIYFIVLQTLNRKAALISAFILAFLPIHICAATKIHVDSIISLFISLSYISFYKGIIHKEKYYYLIAGLCGGFVFWCRELAIFYLLAFVFLPAFFKNKYTKEMIYFLYGGIIMLVSHMLLMYTISGSMFHFFNTIYSQINTSFIHGNKIHEPFYYFNYLFFRPFHTGLLGYLALAGLLRILWLDEKYIPNENKIFYVFWTISLVLLFSFFPISFRPFKFVTKQSNYIIMFTTPLVILSGYFLSKFNKSILWVILFLVFGTSLILSAFEQQSRRNFVSNSKSIITFLESNPNARVYGTVNNANIAKINSMFLNDDIDKRIKNLKQLKSLNFLNNKGNVYAVIDKETMGWATEDLIVDKIPECWEYEKRLKPEGYGFGKIVMKFALKVSEKLKIVPEKLILKMKDYYEPKPADIYLVNEDCKNLNLKKLFEKN